MKRLSVLICDDEPLALDRLGGLLDKCPGVAVVAASLGGEAVLEEIEGLRPDVLLLDIEMPKLDGFDIVEAVSRGDWSGFPPLVVFVTAHPEYAFEAFESGAIDFISKPVRLSRLERALERARLAVEQRQSARRLATLMQTLEELRNTAARGGQGRHIWVQRRSERIRLELDEVETIEAEGEYVRLHAGDTSYLNRGPLSAFAERLGSDAFVRVHRSAIANGRHIEGVSRSSWGGLVLRMRSGRLLPVGRSYRDAVRAAIGSGVIGNP